jgi:hypothetical protein
MRHLPDGAREPWLLQALRTPDEKLVRTFVLGPRGRPRLVALEWYDLAADPFEQRPVSDPSDPRLRAAWTALESASAELRSRWTEVPHSPARARGTRVRERFAGELGALGYAEGGGTAAVEGLEEWLLSPLPPIALSGG